MRTRVTMPKWPAYLMAAAAAACAYPAFTNPPPPEVEQHAAGEDRVLRVEDGRIDLAE